MALLAVTACGQAEPSGEVGALQQRLGDELIVNGDFAAGANSWFLGRWGGSSSGSVVGGHYQIAVTTPGSEWWNVQFMQGGLPLEQGKTYAFSFDAYRGPENGGTQSMVVNVGEDGGDYTSYFPDYGPAVALTSSLAHYSFTFDMTEPDDPAARVEFNCGLNAGTFHIDNVSLREVTEDPGLSIDAGPVHLASGVGETATDALVLENPSTGVVNWSIAASPTWLTVVPASGILASGDAVTVTVMGDAAALAAGDHLGMLAITHDAATPPSPVDVDVQYSVGQQYQPASPYLNDPDLAISFVEDIAAFRRQARDDVNGGFYTYIDRQGHPTSTNTKSLCAQSRLGYAFTRAFALTGDESYLDDAHHALKFLYDHGWDDGWLFATDIQGGYIPHWGHHDAWWSFQQHYALVGIAAMAEVTGGHTDWGDGSEDDWVWLNRGLESNYARLWDPNATGYFTHASRDWSDGWGKGFTPTVDAITTHSMLVALMTEAPAHRARHFELADMAVEHMVGAMPSSGVGFPEVFDTDWSVDYSQAISEPGHHYKTAWCLYRSYLMDPTRTAYKDGADAIMWDMWENGGYDHVYGGPYSKVNWQTGATTNTDKNNWMLEQGVTSGLIGYHAASSQVDRDMLLEVADGSVSFFMNHQLDPVYGEAYSDVSRDGSSLTQPDKGGLFNSGYHSIEMGYYIYLYGNLFVHGEPVSLHYRFPASDESQEIRLTPLAIEDELLRITAVTLDGAPYTNFDAASRTLTLPAGVGGKFRVTFAAGGECGDGVLDSGEACDDGNAAAGDGCDESCQVEYVCGDGTVDPGETCDDGNTDNTDGCLDTCVAAACGDGFVQNGVEECDDGNASNTDGCLTSCVVSTCGDSFVQAQVEACDDGNTVTETACEYGTPACTACSADCSEVLDLVGPYCGDGTSDLGEACDDGNAVTETACEYGTPSCTACSADCAVALNLVGPYCGDGAIDVGEACDDGNAVTETACAYGTPSCAACSADCSATLELEGGYCGDGTVDPEFEACDDGNSVGGDGCDASCASEASCTDGILNGDEEDVDCGGSCPVCACESAVYPVGNMEFSTGGAVSDGYNIWSNGVGTFQHEFDPGEGTVTVWARGEIAGGAAPNMIVSMGSAVIGNIYVDDETMQPYVFAYSSFGGTETITIEFTNDYYQSPADRNLIIGGAEVDCGSPIPTCGDGVVDAGEACDDGNASNNDACLDTCEEATCGDGYVWDGVEECDDGNTNDDDACLNSCVAVAGTGPFFEQGGLVVMEAEHFSGSISDSSSGDAWSELALGSASGGACVQVGPDNGNSRTQKSDVEANAARLDFDVEFVTAGTWHIWVRGASTSSQGWASDSCHAGIDGSAEALYLDYGSSGALEWVGDTITVGGAGVHTVSVFMREDGFIADKVLLTTDPGYTPSGVDAPESPRL